MLHYRCLSVFVFVDRTPLTELCNHHECGGDAAEAVSGLCQQPAVCPEGVQQDAGGQADIGQSDQ